MGVVDPLGPRKARLPSVRGLRRGADRERVLGWGAGQARTMRSTSGGVEPRARAA